MALVHLVYASRPFGYDDLALAGILASARRNNFRDGITGALICRDDLYLQWLEGERAMVDAAYERIIRDDRHAEVTLLINEVAEERLFGDWAMRDDPARSWMWTVDEVSSGAVVAAPRDDICAVFERLARETDAPAQRCPFNHQS